MNYEIKIPSVEFFVVFFFFYSMVGRAMAVPSSWYGLSSTGELSKSQLSQHKLLTGRSINLFIYYLTLIFFTVVQIQIYDTEILMHFNCDTTHRVKPGCVKIFFS